MQEISSITSKESVFKSKRHRRLVNTLSTGQVIKSWTANLGLVENKNILCIVLLIPLGRFPIALIVKAVQTIDNPEASAFFCMREVSTEFSVPPGLWNKIRKGCGLGAVSCLNSAWLENRSHRLQTRIFNLHLVHLLFWWIWIDLH
jgi:hypothetical protein